MRRSLLAGLAAVSALGAFAQVERPGSYGVFSTIGGGTGNTTPGPFSTVSGGGANTAMTTGAVVAGGYANKAGHSAAVGGGFSNEAQGFRTVIGGGGQNMASRDHDVIAGGLYNWAAGPRASIGGGESNQATGTYSSIGGGKENQVSSTAGSVSGGFKNRVEGDSSAVGGGAENEASGGAVVIAGGQGNKAQGTFSAIGGGITNTTGQESYAATVSGGYGNSATGRLGTVPGGWDNQSVGDQSLAAGSHARALHPGSFVWADSSPWTFPSTGDNQVSFRATGGVRFVTGTDTSGTMVSGVTLEPGGSQWLAWCDRESKTAFEPADAKAILEKLAGLPISVWSYKTQPEGIRHIGPMADDFHKAFQVGEDRQGKTIGHMDALGVALAAIQGLHSLVKERDRELSRARAELNELREAQKKLKDSNAELRRANEHLQEVNTEILRRLERLEQGTAQPQRRGTLFHR